jgi:hypothetical protein
VSSTPSVRATASALTAVVDAELTHSGDAMAVFGSLIHAASGLSFASGGASAGAAGAALLIALFLFGRPSVLRRLQALSAVWRPVPFIALLERPG